MEGTENERSLEDIRDRWDEICDAQEASGRRIAVLATFTAERLIPYLSVALADLGFGSQVHLGAYNQIMQELLRPDSATRAARPTTLVVWPRLEELWDGRALPLDEPPDGFAADLVALADAAVAAAAEMGANLIVVLPAVPETRPLGAGDASTTTGVFATATLAREALRRRIVDAAGALVVDGEEIMRAVGTARAYDERLNALAHIPYTEEFFAAVGARIAQVAVLAKRASRKLVVVDADNTLWGGILGEDGIDGVQIGDGVGRAFREFQRYLLELRRAGAVLAVASKNEESDVLAALERPDMVLRKEHLASWRVGWQSKHASVTEIAEELNLGIDSIAFIDDSPAEVAQMRAAHPGVAVVMMPSDPSQWRQVLQRAAVLDRLPPTRDDLKRAEFYQQESARRELQKGLSVADYVRSLEVRVAIEEPGASELARLAQLVNKTNQFNLNCVRRTEAEIATLLAGGSRAWTIRAQDKFGDYGVVGATIVSPSDGGAWTLETCLLSCRAFGRNIEHAMLAHVFAQASAAGATGVVAQLEQTPRNLPARQFFEPLGAEVGARRALRAIEWPAAVARIEGVRP